MRTIFLGVVIVLGLAGCGSADSSGNSGFARAGGSGGNGSSGGGAPAPSGGGATGGGSSGAGVAGGGSSSSGAAAGGTTAGGAATDAGAGLSGVLTAGVWDDGLNYDFFGKYLAAHPQLPGDPGFVTSDYDAAHAAFAQRHGVSTVDATLVLDTTGSMGDEIAYLSAEFENISSAIRATYPGAAQRWALVVYRDTPDFDPGDEYVVRSFDFTSDMQQFAATVGGQSAANGGDYPESPELGLEALQQLSWRTDPSVARLAFWVADAPQHDERAAAMKHAIVDTQSKGIHLYPVSASGTDELLELTMRSAAEITGGRYLFLTDDSGVGDPHKVPEIPCYFVTRLERAIVRVVGMELSGAYIAPDPADILRTAGDPTPGGTCTTGDGQTVTIF